MNTFTDLNIQVGYLDDWSGGNPPITIPQFKALKIDAQSKVINNYQWVYRTTKKVNMDAALEILSLKYEETGDIEVDQLVDVVNHVLRGKHRDGDGDVIYTVQETSKIEVKGCRPCRPPEETCWRNNFSYQLLRNGEIDEFTAELSNKSGEVVASRQVPVQVFVQYHVERD